MVKMPMHNKRAVLLDRLDSLLSRMVELLSKSLSDVVKGWVSVPQFILLKILADLGKASVSQVAAKLQVTPSAVTYLGDGLVRAELVERIGDQEDRRVVWLTMTEKGRRVFAELQRRRREEIERLTNRLSEEEMETLVTILDKICASVSSD